MLILFSITLVRLKKIWFDVNLDLYIIVFFFDRQGIHVSQTFWATDAVWNVFFFASCMDGFCEKKRLIGGVDDSIRNYVCSCLSAAAKAAAEGEEATTGTHLFLFVLLISLSRRAALCCLSLVIIAWVWCCRLQISWQHNAPVLFFFLKKKHNALVFMALWGLHVLVSTIPEAISVFFGTEYIFWYFSK